MANVGLDGADAQRLTRLSAGLEDCSNGTCFDRVSDFGTSAMGFEVLRVSRVESRPVVAVAHQRRLCGLAWRRYAVFFAVLVVKRLADDGPHGVACQ